MCNAAGNKGFIVGAASVQGTRFREAGASQSLHYRWEKGLETSSARSYRGHTGPSPHCPAGLRHLNEHAEVQQEGLTECPSPAPAPHGAPSFGRSKASRCPVRRWGTGRRTHHRPLHWPPGQDGWLEFSPGRKTTQRGKLTG